MNFTNLNGRRIYPRESRVLRHGDEVRLGRLPLTVIFKHADRYENSFGKSRIWPLRIELGVVYWAYFEAAGRPGGSEQQTEGATDEQAAQLRTSTSGNGRRSRPG